MLDLGAIGALSVLIGGDTSGLLKALKEADDAVGKHTTSMRGLVDGAAKYATAVSAAGAVLVGALVTRSFEAIDAQAKLARQLRATSEGLETLGRAAQLAGIEKEAMTAAVRKLDVAIGEASQRNAAYADTFERLHLDIKKLSDMDVDKRVLAVNDAIAKYIPSAERASVATQLFSRHFGAAIASLGHEDIATAAEEVHKLGLATAEVDSQTIERMNDNLSTMNEVARGAANRIAVALAPAIDDIAQRIRQAALDSNGFKTSIDAALHRAVEGAAFLLDMMNGLKVVVKGVELVFQTLANSALYVFGTIVKGYTLLTNALIGTEVDFDETAIGILMQQANARMHETAKEFEEMAQAPTPGPRLIQWYEDVGKAAIATSNEVIKARKKISGVGADAPATEEEKKRILAIREALSTQEEVEELHHKKMLTDLAKLHKQKLLSESDYNDLVLREAKRHEQSLADIYNDKNSGVMAAKAAQRQKLKDIQQSLKSEEAVEQEAYEDRLAALASAHTDELTTDEEHKAALAEAEFQHWANIRNIREAALSDLNKFTKWSFTDQTNHVLGELANLTSGAAQSNRAMFEANKVFGISSAIVNAYVGISKTLSTYPYPINIAMAAGHAIAAFAQVNAIRSQQFGGGGGAAPSIAGSTPAPPVSPVSSGAPGGGTQNSQSTIVNLNGDFFSRKQLRSLLEGLNENGRDGGKILVSG